jgi:hypothetical protein
MHNAHDIMGVTSFHFYYILFPKETASLVSNQLKLVKMDRPWLTHNQLLAILNLQLSL